MTSEAASRGVTKFSFIAYGDTRGRRDGKEIQYEHSLVIDSMLAQIKKLQTTDYPVKFVLQSGDAVQNGKDVNQWNVSFVPLIDRLTTEGGVPYFLVPGNHEATTTEEGMRNYLDAVSALNPPEGSPRSLKGYTTFSFGYGNTFVIGLDANIAGDENQFQWIKGQLEGLDRTRYVNVIVFCHQAPFSSGPHGGAHVEQQTADLRARYMPLFNAHHVKAVFSGHEHLFEHWVEHYTDASGPHRMDLVVSGGGGAPIYPYAGEPDLRDYLKANEGNKVTLEHLVKPGIIFNAILERPPVPPVRINPEVPPKLEEIINKALEKDRDLRYQHAADIRAELQRLKRDTTSGHVQLKASATPTSPASIRLRWAADILLGTILAAVLWWLSSARPSPKVTGINQITHDGINKRNLLTDGTRIYFTERADVRDQLFQVSANGGETAPISVPFTDVDSHDISRDRSELLISITTPEEENEQFSILPMPVGSPRRLRFTGQSAAWSRDGRHLVICKGSDLYLANHDGAELQKLLSVQKTPLAARFSPDGTRIRFTMLDPVQLTYSLWEVRTDGTGLHALFPGWHTPPNECCGKWTADGRYYVFESTDASGSNVWALPEPNGLFRNMARQPVRLTTGPLAYTSVEPDRDGHKLFVVGTQPRGELVRYDSRSKLFIPIRDSPIAGF